MIESTLIKKSKFSLSDYDYQKDLENRLLMGSFSNLDFTVLEEILFSPLKTPLRKIAKNLELSDEELFPVLENLSKTGLFSFEDDSIVIDKTVRRYFETEMQKFEPDFKPGMEFLQNLLKKVPIHVLPPWYALPRTANNIFEAIVEKYLLTPQIFQRHLLEMNLGEPHLNAIAQDLFRSPDLCLKAEAVMKKYQLSKEQLEKAVILLELQFVLCSSYKKEDGKLEQVITPFHEWREYLLWLRNTQPTPISTPAKVERKHPHDFGFIEEMSSSLQISKKQPISADSDVVRKLHILRLVEPVGGGFKATEAALEWLEMRPENRALYLYRHPLNKITSADLPSHLLTEKTIRDAEKAIVRVLDSGWILFEDFIPSVMVAFGEHTPVSLKECGKTWKYLRPSYNPQEISLLRAIIFESLFESGMTAVGTYEGKDCFCVTPFGQSIFG